MDTSKLESRRIHRGAEADLLVSNVDGWKTIIKRRTKKKYRHDSLDESIRHDRTISEADAIHRAKLAGAKVPSIIGIETETTSILMTHIEGSILRDRLDEMSREEASSLFRSLGYQVGLLHSSGIVHGDLTTSNIIVAISGSPFIIDFGMARLSVDAEDRGVDLHLLQRSITTSHVKNVSLLIQALADGYRKTAGVAVRNSTWDKAREISRRGRYFAIR